MTRAQQLGIRRKIGPERPVGTSPCWAAELMIRVWDFLVTARELLKV